MANYTLQINESTYEVSVEKGTSLLWVIREHLGLTGTKYGCGIAQCGACTIHVDNEPLRACVLQVEDFSSGQKIKTIEGLSEKGDHPVQKAWMEHDVPQCGYCQAGQIMSASALLKKNPSPNDEEINQAMNGNICRCGTYTRIRAAIKTASQNA